MIERPQYQKGLGNLHNHKPVIRLQKKPESIRKTINRILPTGGKNQFAYLMQNTVGMIFTLENSVLHNLFQPH